jgi:signal transduction histidine kinase
MPISKNSVVRITVLAILLGLTALLAIVGFNLWLVRQTGISSQTVTEERAVRSAIIDLRDLLTDAETGQRGYLLTVNPDYLKPYQDARDKMPEQLDRLTTRTQSNPAQKADAAKLTAIVKAKLAELQSTIDLQNSGHRDQALEVVNTNRGKVLMDQARVIFNAMVERAGTDIAVAVRDQTASIIALEWVTFIGAIIIVIVVGGSAWTVIVYTRQLVAAQQEVAALNVGLEERVRERTADLGRANEEIQRFAYIVTHDLRAPLVNVMGFTSELDACLVAIQDYMQRQSSEAGEDAIAKNARIAALEDLPEAIGFIRSSTKKMDSLINAILKLSREGRRVLKPEPIRLETLLKSAADTIQHRVTETGGAVEIDAQVPAIISDRLALEQIVGNLLDNAVKYRAPQRPLEIYVRARVGHGQRIVVEVQDNGRGIAKQDHDRVFDLFRRSGAQDQPGEGIGLAHVRTLVRNLGGDITLQSELDQGTTMRIDLPRDLRLAQTLQAVGA